MMEVQSIDGDTSVVTALSVLYSLVFRSSLHIGRCWWAVTVRVVGYRPNLGEPKWIEDLATILFWD